MDTKESSEKTEEIEITVDPFSGFESSSKTKCTKHELLILQKCRNCFEDFGPIYGEKEPFQCSLCGEKYSFLHELGKHYQQTHPKPRISNEEVEEPSGEFEHLQQNPDTRDLETEENNTTEGEPESKPIPSRDNEPRADVEHSGQIPSHKPIKTHIRLPKEGAVREKHQCELCPKTFRLFNSLKTHMRVHTGEYKCKICGACFERRGRLKSHYERHAKADGERVQEGVSGLDKKNEQEKRFQCSMCNKSFRLFNSLKTHAKVHGGEFSCSICGACFERPDHLTKHQQKCHEKEKTTLEEFVQVEVNGETRYECSVCKKTYRNLNNLREHAKIHTEDKVFKCEICDKKIIRADHVERHHAKHRREGPPEEKRNNCSVCDSYFKYNRDRVRHELVKHGSSGKRFICETCGKQFEYSFSLNLHRKTHGEKQYSCSLCNKAYSSLGNLQKHQEIHAPDRERKFQCEICDKKFHQHSHLKTHRKLVHSDGRVDGRKRQGIVIKPGTPFLP